MTQPSTAGCCYIVATPIGHPEDITLRALNVLRSVDAVICEEPRQGRTLLKKLDIPVKELLSLNEHNEADIATDIVRRIAQGQRLALVSDCGTPVFSDPGHWLIQQLVQFHLPVIPIPGPSSLMAALSLLDFKLERFVFGGFLPRQPEARRLELQRLRALRMPVVLMDTPYRLAALLEDVARVFGNGQAVTVACDLTLPNETVYRGPISEVRKRAGARKAEFILIVH